MGYKEVAAWPSGSGHGIVPGSNPPPYHYLDLLLVVWSSTPWPHCVNNQLVRLPPVSVYLFTVSPFTTPVLNTLPQGSKKCCPVIQDKYKKLFIPTYQMGKGPGTLSVNYIKTKDLPRTSKFGELSEGQVENEFFLSPVKDT